MLMRMLIFYSVYGDILEFDDKYLNRYIYYIAVIFDLCEKKHKKKFCGESDTNLNINVDGKRLIQALSMTMY
jgi:hypothetical protein